MSALRASNRAYNETHELDITYAGINGLQAGTEVALLWSFPVRFLLFCRPSGENSANLSASRDLQQILGLSCSFPVPFLSKPRNPPILGRIQPVLVVAGKNVLYFSPVLRKGWKPASGF